MSDIHPSDYDAPRYDLAVAQAATGLTRDAMRTWLQKHGEELAAADAGFGPLLRRGRGRPALITFRMLLGLAAAAPLVRRGASVPDAYMAARAWTWFGEGVGEIGGQAIEAPYREPAELFPPPLWTVLVHHGGQRASVLPAPVAEGVVRLPFAALFRPAGAYETPVLVLLNAIDTQVRQACAAPDPRGKPGRPRKARADD